MTRLSYTITPEFVEHAHAGALRHVVREMIRDTRAAVTAEGGLPGWVAIRVTVDVEVLAASPGTREGD
jgi:hypothetical protein